MAYNPFNIFRRNQKAIFAVVTVIIMFMFVLSSGMTGKADFFNWLGDWLQGRGRKTDVLATLDGEKIRARDIEIVRFQRIIANKYLMNAASYTMTGLMQSIPKLQENATPKLLQDLQMMPFQEQNGMLPPGSTRQRIQSILDDPNAKAADKEFINTMRTREQYQQALQQAQFTGSYLNRTLNRSTVDRDVIEFLIWEKKAKQLGIDFTEDDVKRTLLPREFMDSLRTYDQQIRKQLKSEYGERYNDDLLYTAIAAEFRVRAAQSAIQGNPGRGDQTLNAPPLFAAPYDLYEYYRDKLTTTNYDALRVPVECFISQVKETPTESELQQLFNQRKQYEPDPSKEEPGFREPRKVKIAWVSATGEEPYYKKKAAEWVKLTEQFAKSEVWSLAVPMPGLGVGMAVPIAVPAAIKDPLIRDKYEKKNDSSSFRSAPTIVDTFHQKLFLGWTGASSYVVPHDLLITSWVKPQNLAAAVGAAASGHHAFLAAPNFMYSAAVAAEQRARIKAGMPLFLGGVPGPAMLATLLGGEAAFRENLPKPLSLEVYKPELLAELEKTKAREFAKADLTELQKSISELKETGKSRENAAKGLIAEFIKTRGLPTGGSTEFHGEYTIGDDPGLAPLKAAFDKNPNPHAGLGMTGLVQFGRKFFWKESFNRQGGTTKEPDLGDYRPEFYDAPQSFDGKDGPMFLAWRIADQKEHSVSFTEAKPKVIEAWKRNKARALAKAEAERLAAEIRALPASTSGLGVIPTLIDMEAQLKAKAPDAKADKKVARFPINSVAPFVIGNESGMFGAGRPTLVPFQLRPTDNLPYPTPEMQKKLLDERTQPEKTTFVEADEPKDSYYVIVLESRQERFKEQFQFDVFSTTSGNVGTAFNQLYLMDAQTKARETIMTMLKKEFKYSETDEQKKKLDDREKKNSAE